MNLEKIVFGFFILLALTMNFSFVSGEMDNVRYHSVWLLLVAVVVNVLATGLKLGERSQTGALQLATALVADLQLFAAAGVWAVAAHATESGVTADVMSLIVSLAQGALIANVVSVVVVVVETLMARR